MTSEIRTFIETKDVLGIEIECPKCHVRDTFPILGNFNLTVNCPHCNIPWFDEIKGTQIPRDTCPAIESLRAVALHLWALSNPRTDIHGKIRIQISNKTKEIE
jgi:ssDNA-binding Zn-finger/Zn-ribbon topoisomerase 1